jgi:hypothetical protein
MGYSGKPNDPPEVGAFQDAPGAINLLREPYEKMMFYTVFHPEGMEEI